VSSTESPLFISFLFLCPQSCHYLERFPSLLSMWLFFAHGLVHLFATWLCFAHWDFSVVIKADLVDVCQSLCSGQFRNKSLFSHHLLLIRYKC
jgi:hypothetical protein